MNTLGRHGADESLALALSTGQTIIDAARAADVSERTARRRVADLRGEVIAQAASRLAAAMTHAADRLAHLVDSPAPRTALMASKAVVSLGLLAHEKVDNETLVRELEAKLEQIESQRGGARRMVSRRLLRRVAKLAPALAPPAPSASPAPADESGELAREIGAAFGRLVRHYVRQYGWTPDEARARASAMPEGRLDGALSCPAEELTWWDLGAIANVDPDKALGRWQEVQQAAREELHNGSRAARVLEAATSNCWERAGFLALRAELLETLGCPSALERQLVDQLALWQTLLWRWQEAVALDTSLAHERTRRSLRQDDPFAGPHATESEALEWAERMVERLHRLYLQTLDALRSQRRSPRVVVRGARHVNVAQRRVRQGLPPLAINAGPFGAKTGKR